MAAAYTAEQLAMLEAQVAHFASDDHIRAEVSVWRDASPEERLGELREMCAAGEGFLANVSDERVIAREPLPNESLEILAAIRQLPA